MVSLMNREMMKNHLLKAVFVALLVIFAHVQTAQAAVEGFVTRLNIVFQDGTVMFYTGGNVGLIAGEEYYVISNGVNVATIRLTRVDDYSANAIILSAAAPLQEGIMYTFKYASSYYLQDYIQPKKVKKIGGDDVQAVPVKKSDSTKKDAKKETTKSSDSSSKSSSSSTSSRRRSAASSGDEKAETKTEEPKKKEETKTSRRSESSSSSKDSKSDKKDDKKKKEEPKKKETTVAKKAPRFLENAVSWETHTGMNLLPTADVLPEDQARLAVDYFMRYDENEYIPALNMTILGKQRDISYYFTYGLNENLETTITARQTRSAFGGTPSHARVTDIGFKYRFTLSDKEDKTPVHLGAMVSWGKGRNKSDKVSEGNYTESNEQARWFKYGLVGSITASDLAQIHLYYARDREKDYIPGASESFRTITKGIGLSYKLNDLTDLLLEYKLSEDDTNDITAAGWDMRTREKSLGIRYRLRPYLLIDGAYVIHEEELDALGVRVADFNDNGWLLKLNYLL